jgi:hypothetical protein
VDLYKAETETTEGRVTRTNKKQIKKIKRDRAGRKSKWKKRTEK